MNLFLVRFMQIGRARESCQTHKARKFKKVLCKKWLGIANYCILDWQIKILPCTNEDLEETEFRTQIIF